MQAVKEKHETRQRKGPEEQRGSWPWEKDRECPSREKLE